MVEILSVISSNGPSQPSLANLSTTPDKSEEQSSEIQCICGFHDDDGFTICCDQCDTWQHLYCVDIKQDRVPDSYLCPNCLPRPLDVRRAKEHQQSRREREDKDKIRRKRQKANANTNTTRKRELINNNTTQSNGPGPPTTDRGVGPGKPPSPREGQQHGRKRGAHRASISNATGSYILPDITPPSNEGAAAGAIATTVSSPGIASSNDRNMDIDSDTDMERSTKYRYDFTDITDSPDYYATRDVQTFITSVAAQQDDSIRHFTREDFENISLPKISVHDVPDMTKSYSAQYYITTDAPCSTGQLVAFYKGDIAFQQSYKNDAINQYYIIRHPKPCVLFHPTLPLCIDSRIRGTVARFVRRSCRPNLSLQTIVVDNSEVLFGLFATEPLKANAMLAVEWEWSGSPAIQRLVNGIEPDHLSSDERQEALSWVMNLASNIGECSCINKKECIFNKLQVKREMVFTKPHLNGKDPAFKHPSPEQLISFDGDEAILRVKSRSRDLSPSTLTQEASDGAEMSSRELRKMKNIVSRIERLEQDQPSTKRRKRTGAVLGSYFPEPPLGDWKDSAKVSESGKKTKHSNAVSSPPSTSSPSGILVAQPSTPSRRCSESRSVNSDDIRMSSNLPTQVNSTPEKPKSPIIRIKRPDYVDVSCQTDPCDEPWLDTIVHNVPIRPAPMSLKKRLMRDLLRERKEEANRAAECKKRKQDELDDITTSAIRKERRLANTDDVKTIQQATVAPLTSENPACDDILLTDVEPPEVPSVCVKIETSSTSSRSVVAEPKSFEPSVSETQSTLIEEPNPLEKVEKHNSNEPETMLNVSAPVSASQKATTNGHRKIGLLVQLPPPPDFLATPPTSANTSTSPVLTPGAPMHSPPTLSSCIPNFPPSTTAAINLPGAQPSPTKTKKLSLSEYGNRRKKVDAGEKERSGSFSGKPYSALTPLHEEQKIIRNGDSDHPLAEVSLPTNDATS